METPEEAENTARQHVSQNIKEIQYQQEFSVEAELKNLQKDSGHHTSYFPNTDPCRGG